MQVQQYTYEKDHVGDCSPEKDRQTTVLLKTPITQMIFFNQGQQYTLMNLLVLYSVLRGFLLDTLVFLFPAN